MDASSLKPSWETESDVPEITYLAEVRCVISEGLRKDDVTVEVKDVNGRRQFLHVTPGMVNEDESGVTYLPIGFVEIDRRTRRVLIELPTEADSGANRMWVGFDALRQEKGVVA